MSVHTASWQPYIRQTGEHQRLAHTGGGELAIILDAAITGGQLTVIEAHGRRGDASPFHIHDDAFLRLDGEMTVWGREQHIDHLAVLVDHAVQLGPAPGDLDVGVGSGRGAVSVFRLIRFLGPPAEPDVPVPEHPALHKSVPLVRPRCLVLSMEEGSWRPGSGNG